MYIHTYTYVCNFIQIIYTIIINYICYIFIGRLVRFCFIQLNNYINYNYFRNCFTMHIIFNINITVILKISYDSELIIQLYIQKYQYNNLTNNI